MTHDLLNLIQPVSAVSERDNAHSEIDMKIMENDLYNITQGFQNALQYSPSTGAINPTPQTVKGGLGPLEAFSPVGMGGMGIMKALKGLIGRGGVKGLAGKIGSKMKFPQGFGATQSPRPTQGLPPFIRNPLSEKYPNPLQREKFRRKEIQAVLDNIFNRNPIKPSNLSPQPLNKTGINIKPEKTLQSTMPDPLWNLLGKKNK